MFRTDPQPNPKTYRSVLFHGVKGGYEYQRAVSLRVIQGILIFGFISVLEPYLVHHHKFSGPVAFFIPLLGMVVSIEVADYLFTSMQRMLNKQLFFLLPTR